MRMCARSDEGKIRLSACAALGLANESCFHWWWLCLRCTVYLSAETKKHFGYDCCVVLIMVVGLISIHFSNFSAHKLFRALFFPFLRLLYSTVCAHLSFAWFHLLWHLRRSTAWSTYSSHVTECKSNLRHTLCGPHNREQLLLSIDFRWIWRAKKVDWKNVGVCVCVLLPISPFSRTSGKP